MAFEKYYPSERLKPYIKYYVVSEQASEKVYKVFPSPGLVIGFQYMGKLTTFNNTLEIPLHSSGITGMTTGYKVFKNVVNTGTILVYFNEVGFTHFTPYPAHELCNLSISLHDIFDKNSVNEVEEKLANPQSDMRRLHIVEQFLVSHLRDHRTDQLILEAVRRIKQSSGTLGIKELHETLCISSSPFEKRFRKVVGTSAKKFASIVRFNAVLDQLNTSKTLTEICYENHFFDQAHFIKDFKQHTGDTPENFKRFL